MADWHEFGPEPRCKAGPWVFAAYHEYDSEDSQSGYTAFLFRNKDRTRFGIREFRGQIPTGRQLCHLATRVATNREFRKSLLSKDPRIEELWGGR